jgi:hypothetical protein
VEVGAVVAEVESQPHRAILPNRALDQRVPVAGPIVTR